MVAIIAAMVTQYTTGLVAEFREGRLDSRGFGSSDVCLGGTDMDTEGRTTEGSGVLSDGSSLGEATGDGIGGGKDVLGTIIPPSHTNFQVS